jgi:hypothetical protein
MTNPVGVVFKGLRYSTMSLFFGAKLWYITKISEPSGSTDTAQCCKEELHSQLCALFTVVHHL